MVLMSMTHKIFQNECSGEEISFITTRVTLRLHLQMPFVNHKCMWLLPQDVAIQTISLKKSVSARHLGCRA